MRLSDMVIEVKDKCLSSFDKVFSVSEKYGVVPQESIFKRRIALDDISKYKRVEYGDIVFNPFLLWNRAVGVCFDNDGGCVSPAYTVLRPITKGISKAVHYYLRSNYFISIVDQIAEGSVTRRRTAPLVEILDLDTGLPDLGYLKEIDKCIVSIDNKQDLLITKNKALMDMIQLLFRNFALKNSSIFKPVALAESPFEIIDGDRGRNYPKKTDFCNEGYCLFLNTKNIVEEGFLLDECEFISEQKDSLLRSGKLQRFDVVLTTRGTIGNCAFFDDDIEHENMRINSGMIIIRADGDRNKGLFMYIQMKSQMVIDQIRSHTSGSVQPQLPIRDLKKINIISPPIEIINLFLENIWPMYNNFTNNRNKMRALADFRDLIFTKVIDSELRITA